MFKGSIFDREETNDQKKYYLPKWDLRNLPEFADSIHFIYEIFDQTISENPIDRLDDANQLSEAVEKIISILHNNGRFLDADIPSKCIFCGVGKYSKKTLVPTIHKLPSLPYGQEVQNYKLDYNQSVLQILSDKTLSLPEGNIKQGLYPKYLILTCDYCGNCQLFTPNFEDTQNWKNVEPNIE